MNKTRKTVKRSNKAPSQLVLNKRMREIWAGGLGFLPFNEHEASLSMIRTALRELVNDGAYWNGLIQLRELKKQAAELTERLKDPKFLPLDGSGGL